MKVTREVIPIVGGPTQMVRIESNRGCWVHKPAVTPLPVIAAPDMFVASGTLRLGSATLPAGVVYAGTVNCSQLNAGTVSAAVHMTAPSLTITTSTSETINLDPTNDLKITSSGGEVAQLTSNELEFTFGSNTSYHNYNGLTVTISGTPGYTATLTAQSLSFNGTQVLGPRVAGPGNAAGWTDSTAETWANNLLTALRNQGLIS